MVRASIPEEQGPPTLSPSSQWPYLLPSVGSDRMCRGLGRVPRRCPPVNGRELRRGWGLRDAREGSAALTGCVMPAGMRILVTLLLDTLPMLGNVLLLCFFVFFIFGIVGVQLWAGLLRNRCFLDSTFARCAGPAPNPLFLGLPLEAPPQQVPPPQVPAPPSPAPPDTTFRERHQRWRT